MDREDRSTLVLQEGDGIGSVKVADDVVAMIASLATTEVEGVSSMTGNATNELLNKMGYKSLTKGVKVLVKEGVVSVDLAVTMEYGFNIPITCKKVQEKVKAAIENMTGMTVDLVNVRIAGIHVGKES